MTDFSIRFPTAQHEIDLCKGISNTLDSAFTLKFAFTFTFIFNVMLSDGYGWITLHVDKKFFLEHIWKSWIIGDHRLAYIICQEVVYDRSPLLITNSMHSGGFTYLCDMRHETYHYSELSHFYQCRLNSLSIRFSDWMF